MEKTILGYHHNYVYKLNTFPHTQKQKDTSFPFRSYVLNASLVECWLMPLIIPLIDPWSILDLHSINTNPHSVDISVHSWLIFKQFTWVAWHLNWLIINLLLIKCWWSVSCVNVNWVLIDMLIKCTHDLSILGSLSFLTGSPHSQTPQARIRYGKKRAWRRKGVGAS